MRWTVTPQSATLIVSTHFNAKVSFANGGSIAIRVAAGIRRLLGGSFSLHYISSGSFSLPFFFIVVIGVETHQILLYVRWLFSSFARPSHRGGYLTARRSCEPLTPAR